MLPRPLGHGDRVRPVAIISTIGLAPIGAVIEDFFWRNPIWRVRMIHVDYVQTSSCAIKVACSNAVDYHATAARRFLARGKVRKCVFLHYVEKEHAGLE